MSEPAIVSARLSERDAVDGFDCGVPALDDWLTRDARRAALDGTAVTTVWRDAGRVVGFYALQPTEVRRASPAGLWSGGPSAVPGVRLVGPALDRSVQGRGLGAQLLVDALATVCAAAAVTSVRVVVVEPPSGDAAGFLAHHGFAPAGAGTRMTLLVEAARAALGGSWE